MHACFNVDEIVRLLACELVASRWKKSAVALACCCKNLEDPVLDVLWEAHDQLHPLLKSFPGNIWDDEGGTFTFKRIPTKAEWARFRKYTQRIRTLEVNPSQVPISPDALSVLQHHTFNTTLPPGLKTFKCDQATTAFIPFISLFLSQRTTFIAVVLVRDLPDPPTLLIASMIATLSTICPNLRRISLPNLPRDPAIVTAVSEMLLSCNRDILKIFDVASPLTEATRKVVCRLPHLSGLRLILEEQTSLPPIFLPNLAGVYVSYPHGHEWLQSFRGATLSKLSHVSFSTTSPWIGNFLETFESVALTTPIPTTLSSFKFCSSHPWRPTYSSLLTFKHLTELRIATPCPTPCTSAADDTVIIRLARTMPKLKILQMGWVPCGTPGGVTVRGLIKLARHCIGLSTLRIHMRVNSLVRVAAEEVVISPHNPKHPASREECALTTLEVGNTPLPQDSALTVALVLLRIFPRISNVEHVNPQWGNVVNAIKLSTRLSDRIDAIARSST